MALQFCFCRGQFVSVCGRGHCSWVFVRAKGGGAGRRRDPLNMRRPEEGHPPLPTLLSGAPLALDVHPHQLVLTQLCDVIDRALRHLWRHRSMWTLMCVGTQSRVFGGVIVERDLDERQERSSFSKEKILLVGMKGGAGEHGGSEEDTDPYLGQWTLCIWGCLEGGQRAFGGGRGCLTSCCT